MDYYQRGQVRFGPGGVYFTPAVRYLMIANAAVFLIQSLTRSMLIDWFGLHPSEVFVRLRLWQFVTYMFLHGDFIHILLNMFILWMIGGEVERRWGQKEFLKYYFLCGIGAGFFHLLFNRSSSVPVVGASGAVYGILVAFAMIYPDRMMILFPFPIPLKAKYLAMIFVLVELTFGLFGQSGVAHFAHLGGMLVGFFYLKFGWKISLLLGDFVRKKRQHIALHKRIQKQQRLLKLRAEIDLILDKINEIGYNNLTEKEKKLLKEASIFFSQETDHH